MLSCGTLFLFRAGFCFQAKNMQTGFAFAALRETFNCSGPHNNSTVALAEASVDFPNPPMQSLRQCSSGSIRKMRWKWATLHHKHTHRQRQQRRSVNLDKVRICKEGVHFPICSHLHLTNRLNSVLRQAGFVGSLLIFLFEAADNSFTWFRMRSKCGLLHREGLKAWLKKADGSLCYF